MKAYGLAQRQAGGDLGQRRQVQPVSLEFSARQRGPDGIGVNHAGIPAGPAQAVQRVKTQGCGVELKTTGQLATTQPARHGGQCQRLECLAQPGVDTRQCDISRTASDLPPAHVRPGAQTAAACHDCHVQGVQVDVRADARDIHTLELGIQLARPVGPQTRLTRQQGLPEDAAQAKALAPLRRRRGVQAHRVAATGIAHDRVHPRQGQRRRAPQLIDPADGAALDSKLGLREKPINRCVTVNVSLQHIQPAHIQLATGGAANLQVGPI